MLNYELMRMTQIKSKIKFATFAWNSHCSHRVKRGEAELYSGTLTQDITTNLGKSSSARRQVRIDKIPNFNPEKAVGIDFDN